MSSLLPIITLLIITTCMSHELTRTSQLWINFRVMISQLSNLSSHRISISPYVRNISPYVICYQLELEPFNEGIYSYMMLYVNHWYNNDYKYDSFYFSSLRHYWPGSIFATPGRRGSAQNATRVGSGSDFSTPGNPGFYPGLPHTLWHADTDCSQDRHMELSLFIGHYSMNTVQVYMKH